MTGRGITFFRLTALVLGFGFLYLPIAVLVAYYATNASRIRIAEVPDTAALAGQRDDVIPFPAKAAA